MAGIGEDDDDEEFLLAIAESMKHFEEVELPRREIIEIEAKGTNKLAGGPTITNQSSTSKNAFSEEGQVSTTTPSICPFPLFSKGGPTITNQASTSKNALSEEGQVSTTTPSIRPFPLFSKPANATSFQNVNRTSFVPKNAFPSITSTSKNDPNSSIHLFKPPAAVSMYANPKPGTSKSNIMENKARSPVKNQTLTSIWQNNKPAISDDPSIDVTLISDGKSLDEKGFCSLTGRHWIYPTNYPERKYQMDMVQTALFNNTLVCLPTGLGKTFIAAVVMYNFYRWYPKGKIIFMAPTKPLVAQQINACYNITGVPKSDTEEMTGVANSERRTGAWKQKRLFFATPQVVANDLVSQILPAADLRCLVIDEAHRAQGNYAYCQVINTLMMYHSNFRILALSATPGSDINSVKQVLTNLHIARLKVATEDMPDVAQYTHQRDVEVIKVPSTPELDLAKERFLNIMDKYIKPLVQRNILSNYNLGNLTQFQMKTTMDRLARNRPGSISAEEHSKMMSFCVVSITLCHALELLQNYGLRSFVHYVQGALQDTKTNKTVVNFLSKDDALLSLISELNQRFGNATNKSGKIFYGHPKLAQLKEVMINHFLEHEDNSNESRAIVFCQYRDSVEEIYNVLKELDPIVMPRVFIGQAKSKGTGGLTQKQQLEVMRDFRAGKFNTLISTCVGEEGLDIGEVDLIICVDASKSPIRLVQRMGRTGRKRDGRIIMLLSEGKEHKKYMDSRKQQSSISKAIINNQRLNDALIHATNPRMVPRELLPEIYRSVLVIPQDNKDQDIRKVLKKPTTNKNHELILDFKNWDGIVPEFNQLTYLFTKNMEVFQPLDAIMNPQKLLDEALATYDKFTVNKWSAWLTSLQGGSSTPHSKDTIAITSLMKLSEDLTYGNQEVLTQTAELVSQVDHNLLWNSLSKNKQRNKTTRKKSSPKITKKQNKDNEGFLIPPPPMSKKNTDEEVFQFVNIESETKEAEIVDNELIELFDTKISLDNPFNISLPFIKTYDKIFSVINNTRYTPNLNLEPPDLNSLTSFFEELTVENGVKKICDEIMNTTENFDFSQKSPVLGKRRFSQRIKQSQSQSNRVVRKIQEYHLPSTSRDNIYLKHDSDHPTSKGSPLKEKSSQGLNEFLDDFDFEFENNLDLGRKECPESEKESKDEEVIDLTENNEEFDKDPNAKTVLNNSEKQGPSLGFDDQDDDLFADTDLNVWLHKYKTNPSKKSPESKANEETYRKSPKHLKNSINNKIQKEDSPEDFSDWLDAIQTKPEIAVITKKIIEPEKNSENNKANDKEVDIPVDLNDWISEIQTQPEKQTTEERAQSPDIFTADTCELISPPKPLKNSDNDRPKSFKDRLKNKTSVNIAKLNESSFNNNTANKSSHNVREISLSSTSTENVHQSINKTIDESLLVVKKDKKARVLISDDESSQEIKASMVDANSEEDKEKSTQDTWNKSSEDDDFIQPMKPPVKRKSNEVYSKQKKKKEDQGRKFLNTEAEVSGEDSYDDQECSQMDRYEESFIKEYTQADTSIDMRAQYLRSIKSPLHGPGKFKIPELKPIEKKLLSGSDEEEDYEHDSFCVEEQIEEEELDELEVLEKQLEDNRRKKKKRKRNALVSSDEGSPKKKINKKLKRVIQHNDSSSSDNETESKTKDVEEPIIVYNLSSDEEEDKFVKPPRASSTPHVNKGFEANDYVGDDVDMDALIAMITASQEAEIIKKSSNTTARSLFNNKETKNKTPVAVITPNLNSDRVKPFTKKDVSNIICNDLNKDLPNLLYRDKPSTSNDTAYQSTSVPRNLQNDEPLINKIVPLQNEVTEKVNITVTQRPLVRTGPQIIIVSSDQIISGPQIINALRTNYKLETVIKTTPKGIDYVVSHRLGICRLPLNDVANKGSFPKLQDYFFNLKSQFKYAMVIFENNKHRPIYSGKLDYKDKEIWRRCEYTEQGNRQINKVLLHLKNACKNVKAVFSENQVDTARLIHRLVTTENDLKFGILNIVDEATDEIFNIRLKMYEKLPGVNIALAVYLAHKFSTIQEFVKRCDSPEAVEKLLRVCRTDATSIFRILHWSLN